MAAPINVSKWMSLVHHALYEMSVSSELGQCIQKSNGKLFIKGSGLKLISMANAMMVWLPGIRMFRAWIKDIRPDDGVESLQ